MSVKQSGAVSYSIRAAVALALGTATMLATVPKVMAADDSAVSLEEITVTGSRIKQPDLESSSPLITVDAEKLEQRAGLNIESYLNQLPNYNPALTPVTEAQDVQPTPLNTVGISTISLRGLGANRGLVLVDGHRTTPVNALMVTDINTIPAAMIDRIESISGGASAVYGADAMAGVTNFILKKSFQGLQLDVQDGITQAGDGNELRITALMGTKFSEGAGNIIMGSEYYDRKIEYQYKHDFYKNSWTDPNVAGGLFINGYNGYALGNAAPTANALNAVFPARAATGQTVFGFPGTAVGTLYFNNDGTLVTRSGNILTGNYNGPTSGPSGFGLQNVYDSTYSNTAAATNLPLVPVLKWNNPTTPLVLPDKRYSFFANGTYDLTDKVKFFTNFRFAQSDTLTQLSVPTTAITGWEANIPFLAGTDSPINPALVTNTTSLATLQGIAASFVANPTATNPNYNPGFIGIGKAGVQHPVPWQIAMLLLSRGAANGVPANAGFGLAFGAPITATCNNQVTVSVLATGAALPACGTAAPTSWQTALYPGVGAAPQRSTVDTDTSFQLETGLDFPLMVGDWTGELYYSRGQSTAYQDAYGNDALQRYRAVMDSPGYGAGLKFQGNANSANANFGTAVPSTCTSGFYNVLFNNGTPSADCQNAIGAILQTMSQMYQDVVEANFQGSLFRLPAGEVSGALGYQYRRDAGTFTPDNLQGTSSFLDQTVGVYPTGTLNAGTANKDVYGELLIPVLSDIPFIQKLSFDLGGRWSKNDFGPNATTFKINADWRINKAVRVRGGFNRATRAPNMAELFLNAQELIGGGPSYGDPCSLRSLAPFGAGAAATDVGTSANLGPATLANSKGAAGATSTYLICQAMMGGTGSVGASTYYGATTSQSGSALPVGLGFLDEQGNSKLKAETADTWTGGIVLSNLSDSGWLSGFTLTLDYYRISIENAIQLQTADYSNYLCFGANTVADAAGAAAVAASGACQNVPRNLSSGGSATQQLQFDNLATIQTSGVDMNLNWFSQFADLGLSKVPGGLSFSSTASWLNYYRTKASPLPIDLMIDWKGSTGPTLNGINGGAYTYRFFNSFTYVLPSFTAGLQWTFLPSVNSSTVALQRADIKNNAAVAAGGAGPTLSYTPWTNVATPHYNKIDATFSWTLNKMLQIRGGVDNVFNRTPPTTAQTKGYPLGTNLTGVCAGFGTGCVNPRAYSLPSDGQGITTAFYDINGRTYFLGLKATF
ncbi:MAG TPA: TonB-dependent receptor [Steroidobacteraceae bacterium]|jgi:outer membrane receptor protein involved in Fe transport